MKFYCSFRLLSLEKYVTHEHLDRNVFFLSGFLLSFSTGISSRKLEERNVEHSLIHTIKRKMFTVSDHALLQVFRSLYHE
jgi:hypothetical protein